MSKKLNKVIAGSLIVSSIVTNSKVEAYADATAVLEVANEVSMACPYIAPLVVTGTLVVTGITTVIGIKQDTKEEVIYRSYTHLPDTWRPGSVVEKINPQGKCIQRRFYDSKGKPLMDIDLNDHGMPEAHPFGHGGAHKHIYNNNIKNVNKRRQKGVELTDEEYKNYVKDFDRSKADRMKVRWIED